MKFNKAWLFLSLWLAVVGGYKISNFTKFASPNNMADRIHEYLKDNSEISGKCAKELEQYMQGLRRGELWALKMFDSASRILSGMLSGNLIDFGAFHQCLNIRSNTGLDPIYGKYCLGIHFLPIDIPIEIPLGNKSNYDLITTDPAIQITINPFMPWAVCSPSSCTARELMKFYAENGVKYLLLEPLCQDRASPSTLDSGTIATITFLAVILILMFASTAYDLLLHYKEERAKHSLLIAFSVITNGKKLFTLNTNPNDISSLHGIRTISLIWIMLGHKYSMYITIKQIGNYLDVLKWILKKESTAFIQSIALAVDTFLLLSGFLLCLIYMKTMDKSRKLNIFVFYFHRYLRLTPALCVVMLFYIFLMPHFASSPTWPIISSVLNQPCKDYWWSTLLYVQNYVNPSESLCNLPTWYLSVDMQLYLLSPLVLIPLQKKPKYGLIFLALLIFCSVLSPFLVTWFYGIHLWGYNTLTIKEPMNYNKYYYYPTHTRASAWLIGILLGYIVYKTQHTKINIGLKKYQLQGIAMGFWALAFAIMFTCTFEGYDLAWGEYDKLKTAFFLSLVPFSWAIAVAWIIFACVHGYGGPFNWFLSLPLFQYLSKLGYSMYLLHYPMLVILAFQETHYKGVFKDHTTIHTFWGDFTFTFMAAVVLTLSFESPVLAIERKIFRRN